MDWCGHCSVQSKAVQSLLVPQSLEYEPSRINPPQWKITESMVLSASAKHTFEKQEMYPKQLKLNIIIINCS